MQNLTHFNKATILTFLTIGLSGLQSYLLHIFTTDFAHKYFSEYFYLELAIFILTITTGLKSKWSATAYFIVFIIEVFWFIKTERPYGPDHSLMLIAGAIRIYILIWLLKQLTNNVGKNKANT